MYVVLRCTDCDCVLWSDHAKAMKLCPECEAWEETLEEFDLEDRLEELLK